MLNKIILHSTLLVALVSIVLMSGCKKGEDNITTATCTDGIQNGTETGVDCGGSCAMCSETLTVAEKCAGMWRVSSYFQNGQDQTTNFTETYRDYVLHLDTPFSNYTIKYNDYTFAYDSFTVADTIGYDSANMQYVVMYDTFYFTDTTITPHVAESGSWAVINNDADLELNHGTVYTYNILAVDSLRLNLSKGTEEYRFRKTN